MTTATLLARDIRPPTADDIIVALAEGEMYYAYQPKTSFETGELVGAEALIRWRRGHQLIEPDSFIPLAERERLTPGMFIRMLPRVVADIEEMRRHGIHIPVSVNLSPGDLATRGPAEALCDVIQTGRLEGSDIQIEITESMVIADDPVTRSTIKMLLDRGVKLLMDDFGTGYSSIDVLSRFPFAYVKLDKGLISRMAVSLKNYRIVKGILHLTEDMNIATVAEGVESRGDYQSLQLMGCTQAQGFYISPALAIGDFAAFAAHTDDLPGTRLGTLFSLQASLAAYRKSIVGTVMCMFGEDIAAGEISAIEQEIEHDPENCRFGKWYRSDGRLLADLPGYAEIEEPHRRMREIGLDIIQAAYRGTADFATVAAKINDLYAHGYHLDQLLGGLIEAFIAREKGLDTD